MMLCTDRMASLLSDHSSFCSARRPTTISHIKATECAPDESSISMHYNLEDCFWMGHHDHTYSRSCPVLFMPITHDHTYYRKCDLSPNFETDQVTLQSEDIETALPLPHHCDVLVYHDHTYNRTWNFSPNLEIAQAALQSEDKETVIACDVMDHTYSRTFDFPQNCEKTQLSSNSQLPPTTSAGRLTLSPSQSVGCASSDMNSFLQDAVLSCITRNTDAASLAISTLSPTAYESAGNALFDVDSFQLEAIPVCQEEHTLFAWQHDCGSMPHECPNCEPIFSLL